MYCKEKWDTKLFPEKNILGFKLFLIKHINFQKKRGNFGAGNSEMKIRLKRCQLNK